MESITSAAQNIAHQQLLSRTVPSVLQTDAMATLETGAPPTPIPLTGPKMYGDYGQSPLPASHPLGTARS